MSRFDVPPFRVRPDSEALPCFDVGFGSVPTCAIEFYEREGAVCLRNVLGRAWVGQMRRAVSWLEKTHGASAEIHGAPGKRFIDDVNVHRRHKTVRRLVFESHVPLVARTLLRSRTLTFYFDNLFVKEPGAGPTPWHQDASYQRTNGRQNVNVWLSLDEIPVSNSIQFKRRSHLWWDSAFKMESFGPSSEKVIPIDEGRMAMPPMEQIHSQLETIAWAMSPGDALAWNHRTLHAASGNTQDRKRRSLAIVYLGDDIRYNAAPGATDRRWDTTALKDGAPMTSAAYPRVL